MEILLLIPNSHFKPCTHKKRRIIKGSVEDEDGEQSEGFLRICSGCCKLIGKNPIDEYKIEVCCDCVGEGQLLKPNFKFGICDNCEGSGWKEKSSK